MRTNACFIFVRLIKKCFKTKTSLERGRKLNESLVVSEAINNADRTGETVDVNRNDPFNIIDDIRGI